jgi:hypothetical protein
MTTDGFYDVPFALDGEFLGIHHAKASDLSPKWLKVCRGFLRTHETIFRGSMGQILSHIEFKLDAFGPAGLGTFYADGEIALSTIYLPGKDASELNIARLFVEYLRRSPVIQAAQTSTTPFEAIMTFRERPLHGIVIWGNPKVKDEDYQLISELAKHFAAAFLFPSEAG